MKRQDFIKAASGVCLACAGGHFLAGQEVQPAVDPAEREKRRREMEERFKQAYILTLMENLEKSVAEPVRTRMMNDCGRACARRGGLFKLAEENKGDLKAFLARMSGVLGEGNARLIDETTVHWSYPRCFCELVAAGPRRLPAVYCQCSVGWVMEIFQTVLGRPAKVDIVQSIKTGAPACVFRVDIG
ncbi:MAG TPA: DUF6144 family protein [Candidatus Aminicenantes bacterium]|nr:DUF6144 family protein [Candidatus Aminicenantes bacterium]HRY64753.1 DUF6144 family protein [Candidatus Aminicenantes bacterium]HRZ71666.1 DUF6144 family protein [Candidatus Aminicenantes bacterium]